MEKKDLHGKRVVVVDDDPHFRQKYASLAQELGASVVMAEGVRAGIEVILAERPDAVITDKDMPDGSGNDVADAVKRAYQDVPVAGITGGNPADFNDHVDVKLSKGISNEHYKMLVQILADSKAPKADFERAMGKCPEADAAVYNDVIAAVDILVQGYMLAEQVIAGKQPVKDVVLGPIDAEKARALLAPDQDIMGPDVIRDAYRKMAEAAEALKAVPHKGALRHALADFAANKDAAEFIDDLAEGRVDDIIRKKQYAAFHDKFVKVMEAYDG